MSLLIVNLEGVILILVENMARQPVPLYDRTPRRTRARQWSFQTSTRKYASGLNGLIITPLERRQ